MPTCALQDVPETHRKARASLVRFDGVSAATEVWVTYVKNKAALIVIGRNDVYVVSTGVGSVATSIAFNRVDRVHSIGQTVQFRLKDGSSLDVSLEGDKEAALFFGIVSSARQAWLDSEAKAVRLALSSPEGPTKEARAAQQRGDEFFQVEIQLGNVGGESRWGSSSGVVSRTGQPAFLAEIEYCGWHLENVGYIYIETGSTSTDRLLRTGQGTVKQGMILGIYLFRRVGSAEIGCNVGHDKQ